MNAQITQYPMASLYVGDLHPEVTEAMLYEKFSTAAGPVLSIRVCRDLMSRKSLGYAYVNFQNPADAERALDTMNFDEMKGRPIRIMWSQRDPSLRRSGVGNVFIKNLDKGIEQKSLYDTFAAFGNILSCKIATDEHSHSKGYGFVHFETQEAANQAIAKVNGMLLNNKKVYVGPFVPRKDRAQTAGDIKFTNCFVKNFGDDLNDESLRTLFEAHGEVTSAKVMIDDNTKKSRGFGFVCFKNPDDAAIGVKILSEFELNGRKIFVGRAQKKQERSQELKVRFERLKVERMNRYQQGVNLYVKNLDDSIDDGRLKEEFDKYGDITSAKVMTDQNGRSKGFGFVCFSKPDEATRAVTDMNGKLVAAKPLYVALAQRKEDRKAHLHNQYMQRIQQFRLQQGQFPNQMYGAGGGYLVPTMGAPQRFFAPGPIALRPAAPRWSQQGPNSNAMAAMAQQQTPGAMVARHQIQNVGPVQARQPGMQHLMMNQQQQNIRGPQPSRPITGAMPPHAMQHPSQAQRPMMQNMQQRVAAGQQQPMQMPMKKAATEIAGAAVHPQAGDEAIHLPNQAPLTTSELANAPPREQKQMLGERLYPLVHEMYPQHCGKITGMLLEIDNSELLHMLESKDSLKAKVDEAYQVLQAHQTKISTTVPAANQAPQTAMTAAGDS